MALRPFIKLLLVSAWAWGSWAFIQRMVTSPAGIPAYVNVFFSIWEAVFFAALFIFIEKFILQLIGTFSLSRVDPRRANLFLFQSPPSTSKWLDRVCETFRWSEF